MNKKIILTSLIILGTTLFSHSAFSYENVISDYVNINKDRTYNGDTKIADYFETIDASLIVNGDLELGRSANIDGDLTVNGNLKVKDYFTVEGNLKVTGTIELGDYADIKGTMEGKSITTGRSLDATRVISHGDLEVEDYATISDGVSIKGNFVSNDYLDLNGYSKIIGYLSTGRSFNIGDTTYIYSYLDTGDYFSFSDDKIKVVNNFDTKDYSEISGRIYIYGEKTYGRSYDEKYSNYSGIMGEIDPLLLYNLSKTQIMEVKNRITNDYGKVQNLEHTQDAYNTMKSLYSFLETKIEKETWDQNKFYALKERELKKFKYYIPNSQTVISSENVSTSKYTPTLPLVLEKKLDKIIEKLSTKQKAVVYNKLVSRIDEIITKLEQTTLTEKAIKKINILLGIQEYMQRKIDAFDNYEDIIKELGL